MKNRFLLSAMFLLLLVGFYVPASFSQTPTYTLTLSNETATADVQGGVITGYEFDVYLLRTGSVVFNLYGIQAKLNYIQATLGGHAMTAAWVAGSTDASLIAHSQQNTLSVAAGYVRIISAPASSFAASTVISNVAPGTKLGRLRLSVPLGFVAPPAALGISFSYANPFKTTVSGYNQDGSMLSVDVTLPASQIILLANAPLPVELSSFASASQGRTVVLNWSTRTEKNSDRFEVERSLVANNTWSTVGSVKAAVLSNSTKNYSYSDTKLQSGKYQYRLKMVDNNGSFSYSSVEAAEVSVPKDFSVSQNYPNPFNPSTKIDYQVPVDAKVIMEVYNIAGQKVMDLVNQQMSAGYYTVDFGASKLSSGVYIYRLVASDLATGHNFSSIKKMMLLK